MRKNLVRKIKATAELFPGIIGYDHSVIPQVENAILSGQDIVFLGERGQAKSRLIRSLVSLLDEAIPIIDGCEINDNPYVPICRACRDRVLAQGDDVPIRWITPDQRYSEKLATPDTAIADLIGEVDPIRVAEGKYLADELTIHYGLVPRTNRGIFAINELPDLAERIQVALLNVLEERDIQVRGYQLRLPLDLLVVASAAVETVAAAAVRRAALVHEDAAVARVCDLPAVIPASRGKVEFDDADEGREFEVLEHLLRRAIVETYRSRLAGMDLRPLQERFDGGLTVTTGDAVAAQELLSQLGPVPVLSGLLDRLEPDGVGEGPTAVGLAAAVLEFALEGLYLNRRVAKDSDGVRTVYGA